MPSSLRLELTKRAERDLRAILRHSLRAWGPAQRDAYEARLVLAMHNLVAFPDIGRSRDDLGRGIRSHPVEQLVNFYRVRDDALRVVRILHGKMEPVGRL